mgnify:CR=1 FL=1
MATNRESCEHCGEMISSSARICPYCRSAAPHRSKNILGWVACAVIAGAYGVHKYVMPLTSLTSEAQSVVTEPYEETQELDANTIEMMANATDEVSLEPVAEEASVHGENTEVSATSETVESSVPTPSTSPALSKAIDEAVEKGETVRWKDDSDSGYVVVSEPQSGGQCRNMYYTAESQGKDWQSNVTTICS